MFLAVGLALMLLQVKLRTSQQGSRGPPSLPALPIIGSLLSLRSSQPPHVMFRELQAKYGQTYSLMMGSHNVIIVNEHSHAKEVLLKKGKIFAGRPRTVSDSLSSSSLVINTDISHILVISVFQTDLRAKSATEMTKKLQLSQTGSKSKMQSQTSQNVTLLL